MDIYYKYSMAVSALIHIAVITGILHSTNFVKNSKRLILKEIPIIITFFSIVFVILLGLLFPILASFSK